MATEVFQQNYRMLISLIRIHTSLELRDLFLEPSGMGLTHLNPCESPTHRFPKSRPVTVRNSNGDSGVHRKWLAALQLQRTWDYWPCLLSRHNVAITVEPLATRTADPVCPYFQEPLYFHCPNPSVNNGFASRSAAELLVNSSRLTDQLISRVQLRTDTLFTEQINIRPYCSRSVSYGSTDFHSSNRYIHFLTFDVHLNPKTVCSMYVTTQLLYYWDVDLNLSPVCQLNYQNERCIPIGWNVYV